MSGTDRRITKRACDGCKIRKIKCSGASPCDGCLAVRISCTFLKHPSTRGPRKLRTRTLHEIAKTQRDQGRDPSFPDNDVPSSNAAVATETSASNANHTRIPVASLVLQLCVFRLRMFPVWPVVKVEEVIAALQRNEEDMETYALASAVGAATTAQLKLTRSSLAGDTVTGEMMEAECQRARTVIKSGMGINLTALRTAFFLHVYHENQEAGGIKSLLYMREAITIGQMMGLHRESSYTTLSPGEQQVRRRILWLLFVTERGVAMLHRLPVVIKPNILFPSMDFDDETFVLPAFQKLVNLFWIFDQSGAFDILQDSNINLFGIGGTNSPRSCLDSLQKKLREIPVENDSMNDIQTADICVTRQWMRAVLWRFSVNHGLLSSISSGQTTSLSYPFQIAKEFLGVISQLPSSAIEAHGLCMELKIYEIASSVTDAISRSALSTRKSFWASSSSVDRPGEILSRLHRILSSCRGGNKTLVSMLCNKIAQVQDRQILFLEPSSRVTEDENNNEPWSIERTANFNANMNIDITGDANGQPPYDHLLDHQLDYQEQAPPQEFNEIQKSTFLISQTSSVSSSNISPPLNAQEEQQRLPPPFSIWDYPYGHNVLLQIPLGTYYNSSRETIEYLQPQQDVNLGIFTVAGSESRAGRDSTNGNSLAAPASIGDTWNLGMETNMSMGLGPGMDLGASMGTEALAAGPEAVERWN